MLNGQSLFVPRVRREGFRSLFAEDTISRARFDLKWCSSWSLVFSRAAGANDDFLFSDCTSESRTVLNDDFPSVALVSSCSSELLRACKGLEGAVAGRDAGLSPGWDFVHAAVLGSFLFTPATVFSGIFGKDRFSPARLVTSLKDLVRRGTVTDRTSDNSTSLRFGTLCLAILWAGIRFDRACSIAGSRGPGSLGRGLSF